MQSSVPPLWIMKYLNRLPASYEAFDKTLQAPSSLPCNRAFSTLKGPFREKAYRRRQSAAGAGQYPHRGLFRETADELNGSTERVVP